MNVLKLTRKNRSITLRYKKASTPLILDSPYVYLLDPVCLTPLLTSQEEWNDWLDYIEKEGLVMIEGKVFESMIH